MSYLCASMTKTTIKIRGYHCDSYGHVNNARYLEIFEEARWRLLDEFDILEKITALNCLFFVVHIDISFKLPVEDGSIAEVTTDLKGHSTRKIVFEQKIFKNGESRPSTVALVTFVLFDQKTGRAAEITEDVISIFEPINF